MNPIGFASPRVAPSPQLIEALKKYALKKEPVVLSSGEQSDYYVDVKQAMLRPDPARIVGPLIADAAHEVRATTVGGMVEGAIPVACAAIYVSAGNDLVAFFIRKERKKHGLQRLIEGPDEYLRQGTRCLIVDDVVTKGSSTVDAIRHAKDKGLVVAGAVAVVDRLAGGTQKIEAELGDAPYWPLVTIDELYPERADRA
ncbi:MAG: orotate phosphoribosyltransferase [Solirubrobacterales bacterium]